MACAVNLYTRVHVQVVEEDGGIETSLIIDSANVDSMTTAALTFIYEEMFQDGRPALRLSVESQLPPGCGLGSSGALSVAVAAAFYLLLHKELNKEEVKRWALKAENVFHGKTSGIDVHCSLYGGMVKYQNGVFSSMAFKRDCFPGAIIINTAVKRSTRTLGVLVKERPAVCLKKIGQVTRAVCSMMDDDHLITKEAFNDHVQVSMCHRK